MLHQVSRQRHFISYMLRLKSEDLFLKKLNTHGLQLSFCTKSFSPSDTEIFYKDLSVSLSIGYC